MSLFRSIFNGAGYFRNDDRASGGKLAEDDVLNCFHCQKTLKKADWKIKGGMCFVCANPICHGCVERTKTFGCEIYEKQIAQAVETHYRRQQNAKLLGL